MCTFLLQNVALLEMGLMHCGICATGLLPHIHYMQPCTWLFVVYTPQWTFVGLALQAWCTAAVVCTTTNHDSKCCTMVHSYSLWTHMICDKDGNAWGPLHVDLKDLLAGDGEQVGHTLPEGTNWEVVEVHCMVHWNSKDTLNQWLSARLQYLHCLCTGDIKNNVWVTVNNDFFVTSEAIRQWFSRETKSRVKIIADSPHEWQKKSLFTVMNVLFYFLYAISCHERTNPLRTITERSFRHCCQGWPFLTEHCDVTTIDLWRHANAKYWYCDVIFVYCYCTRNLAQRRSSLVNNSREYRYLATRYSRLSV